MGYKGKDEDQVNWINALKGFFTSLVAFIKQYHTTGLVWKKGGEAASAYVGAAPAAAAPAAPAGGPAPPPPPAAVAAPARAGADMNALFSQINKGTDISSGLKKGTPKFELEGNKWVCEFQDDANLAIDDTEPKQTVYLYKNDNTVVNVKGQKINSICIDNCNKCGIVFNNAIAVVELVNCNSVEIQCQGRVPSFAIDKCSSIQVILSKDCLDTEIVTSKSDQVNVLIPGPDGDLVELAVPEQFKTTIDNGKLNTGCVEHV